MNLHSNIDWLTMTGHPRRLQPGNERVTLDEAVQLAMTLVNDFYGQPAKLIKAPHRAHYAFGFKDVHSELLIYISTEWNKQGIMLVWSGETCKNVASWQHIVEVGERWNFRGTRIDVAFNALNYGQCTREIIEQYMIHAKKDGKRRYEPIFSPNGDTLNIGSRESDRFLRVYDKGKQLNVDLDWLRIELEIKGDLCRQNWQSLLLNHERAIPDILKMLDLPDNEIMKDLEILQTEPSRLKAFKAPEFNARFNWLMLQVVPAYADLLEEKPDLALRFLSELQQRTGKSGGAGGS